MKHIGFVIFSLVVLVLQIFFLDRMWSGLYISLYLAIILLLDIKTPQWLILILAFLVGGIIDVATAGSGLCAAVTVFLSILRLPIINFTLPSSFVEGGGLIITSEVPTKNFFLYLILAFAVWSIPFFLLESGFTSILQTLIRILFNIVLGPIVIFLLQLLLKR